MHGAGSVKHLLEYIDLQHSLVGSLQTIYGDLSDSVLLGKVPRAGEVIISGRGWSFQKHGRGILFTEKETRTIVDVHCRITEPDLFDAWRLRTYFGSLGQRGVKIINKVSDESHGAMHEKIKKWINILEAEGAIEEQAGCYRICRLRVGSPKKAE